MTQTVLSPKAIHELAASVLGKYGCNAHCANTVAATINAAERDGCHSHGLMRLTAT